MLKPVDNARSRTRLADMGVVRAQGVDVVKFLQGQVSNDVARLAADRSVLAGLHNPQGRVIALLRLALAGPDEILALVPRELAAPVAARLAKFVLRAKVKIADVSAEWEVAGVQLGGIAEGLATASVGAARRDEEGRLWVSVAPSRWLVAEPRGAEVGASLDVGSPMPSMSRDEWRALDIASGIPQVYAATSETFVAQMLNLDLLDGIAFDKGCYTGQEVIARAHYRGKVKRRMQRFRTREPARLDAGDAGTLNDGRNFKVADAVQLSDGRCEFLAVTTFGEGSDDTEATATASPSAASPSAASPSAASPSAASPSAASPSAASLSTASPSAASSATGSSATASSATASSGNAAAVNAEPLPLPYLLPA